MADYALTGKKGTGKSKNAVRLAKFRYLAQGKRVATNLDLNLLPMFGPRSRVTYVRIPDKPSSFDLEAVGHGNPASYDEELNGGMFLDELGTWLNTRTFSDKDRAAVLDWLAHARKHGWDCYYIMQNVVQVDKQVRESFIEFTVRHTRFDRVKWPFVGGILAALFGERAGYMPRFHVASTRLGVNPQDMVTDRATFSGKDLHQCYDTRQVFRADYPHGTYSALSPWHLVGRFMPAPPMPLHLRLLAWYRGEHLKRRPVTVPSPAFARVRQLCARLPAADALRLMARYSRFMDSNAERSDGARAPKVGTVHPVPGSTLPRLHLVASAPASASRTPMGCASALEVGGRAAAA